MNQKKIELFESILFDYSSSEKGVILNELYYIRKALNEIKWRNLSDQEKQNRRRAVISFSRKIAMHDGVKDVNYYYQEKVIVIYDMINELLEKVEEMSIHANHSESVKIGSIVNYRERLYR
jgi:hypothetical protein